MHTLLAFSAMILAVSGQQFIGGDIGIYDGHLYGMDDDIHHDHFHGLRSGLGIAGVGGVVAAGGGIRVGNQMGLRRCQRGTCARRIPIPPQCKYVPVFRDVSGMFCRGCAENICMGGAMGGVMGGAMRMGGVVGMGGKGGRRAINKRMRKIRRRICRSTGMCIGDTLGPVGMGGVNVIRGGGAIGGVGPMGGIGALVGGGRLGYGGVVG